MSKQNVIFVAGVGVGIGATLVLSNREVRTRLEKALLGTPLGTALRKRSKSVAKRVSVALSDAEGTLRKGERAIGDITNQVKHRIDYTAETAKKVIDKVADTSKGAAHKAGDHLERTGRRLQAV